MTARHRFLAPDWATRQRGRIELPAEERRHLAVVRVRDGEEIEVFDGRGRSCRAVLRGGSVSWLEDLPDHHRESPLAVTLAVAALKKDRLEWLIEKVTEVGARRIVVYHGARTVARPSARKHERWRQIAVGAAKQSGRTVVPEISADRDFNSLFSDEHERAVILQPTDSADFGDACRGAGGSFLLLIGPEGGFSGEEIDFAVARGAIAANLGRRTLRAETAAIVAAARLLSSRPETRRSR